MKCFVEGCSAEIDELKEFPITYGPGGQKYDEAGQRAHAATLEQWTFVEVSALEGGKIVKRQGHVCPGHKEGA